SSAGLRFAVKSLLSVIECHIRTHSRGAALVRHRTMHRRRARLRPSSAYRQNTNRQTYRKIQNKMPLHRRPPHRLLLSRTFSTVLYNTRRECSDGALASRGNVISATSDSFSLTPGNLNPPLDSPKL